MWRAGAPVQYSLFGRNYRFATDYDDITGVAGNTGEGGWHDDTGNGYHNGLQFLLSTWQSVKGDPRWDNDPSGAPVAEQVMRAYKVWLRDGQSFHEWGYTRTACGLR